MSVSGLLFRVANAQRAESLASRFRARRFDLFANVVREFESPVRVLDVGGTLEFWYRHLPMLGVEADVTAVNLEPLGHSKNPCVRAVQGDARDLSRYKDRSFDVVFSNSLLEHVGDFAQQQLVANELKRLGKRYFVQTPNYFFPLEPHFLVPFWQFLPIPLRTSLVQAKSLGWMPQVPDRNEARAAVTAIRLLSAGEMKALFPGATIFKERVGPLTKSFVAVGAGT